MNIDRLSNMQNSNNGCAPQNSNNGCMQKNQNNSFMPQNINNGAAHNQNGRSGSSAPSSDALRAIQELCFVKAELELYLDTHPDCKTALDYYHKTVDALDKLMAEYQAKGTPIVAMGSVDSNHWNWIKGPWPWQKDGESGSEG